MLTAGLPGAALESEIIRHTNATHRGRDSACQHFEVEGLPSPLTGTVRHQRSGDLSGGRRLMGCDLAVDVKRVGLSEHAPSPGIHRNKSPWGAKRLACAGKHSTVRVQYFQRVEASAEASRPDHRHLMTRMDCPHAVLTCSTSASFEGPSQKREHYGLSWSPRSRRHGGHSCGSSPCGTTARARDPAPGDGGGQHENRFHQTKSSHDHETHRFVIGFPLNQARRSAAAVSHCATVCAAS
jgi:hypothetical protein